MFDRILRLSVGNSVFVTLTFILVVAVGLSSAFRLPREEFPEVRLDKVLVVTTLPGATAEDIEELVSKPIEDALEDVDKIDQVQSTSQAGMSSIIITFLEGTDLESARSEVEKAVSTVDEIPEDAETPIVRELTLELPVVALALLGDPSATQIVEDLSDRLREVDGVATVNLLGESERKIFVDLDERSVRSLGLRPERSVRSLGLRPGQVADAIRRAHVNVPAGAVALEGEEIFVKTEQRLQSAADVARIPLLAGSTLRVGDVATVTMTPDRNDTRLWVDGTPAVKFIIGREQSADPLKIRKVLLDRLDELKSELPPGLDLVLSDDYTVAISDRLEIVGVNAVSGGVLVIAVLLVMSGFRQAMLALLGMPVSFLMATFLMGQTDITINVVSTFGLLIAIGIIVDDAIVVIENVQRHLEMGKTRTQATIDGAKEVILPVTVAVLTTCLAFVPLTLVSGTMGRIMQILPLVVIFCLMGSLFEATFLLPGHLAHFGSRTAEGGRTARLVRRMKAVYAPPLGWCIRHPYLVCILVALGLVGTVGLATRMPFQLNAPAKPTDLQVLYELMPGENQERSRVQAEAMDAIVQEHIPDAVRTKAIRTGSYFNEELGRTSFGANLGKVRWDFVHDEASLAAYPAMVRELRLHLATNPDLGAYSVKERVAGPPAGAGVTAKLRGRDIDELDAAVAAVKGGMSRLEGVSDIRDNYGAGKETFRVVVDQDRAARLGLTELDIGNTVRAAIDGLLALEVSIDQDPVEILVRYEGAEQRDRRSLSELLIALPSGGAVRLDQVARIERVREAAFVNREDGFRTVRVLGELDTDVNSPLGAQADLQKIWDEELAPRFAGVTLGFGGEAEELVKSLEDLPALFGLAILMIYFVLALQFRSYLQPVIIIAAVPFGLMGAVLGLASLGYDLSIFAMFGMVALAGIVVNDSLVMVDFVNKRREEGVEIREAVRSGALDRLRPIVSTTLTTCLGLLPMALGVGGRDEVLAPMAIAIAAGLGIATILVLLAIPSLYLIVDDAAGFVRRWGRTAARED